MKKFTALFCLLAAFVSCEKPSDCIESTGDIVTRQFDVVPFTRLEVYKGIEVVITQGPSYSVAVETGENLLDNIEVSQHDNVLLLRDNSTCNWVREFGHTKVHITAPNIEEIYSKSDRNISSNGTLTYPILRLFALDADGDGVSGAGTGDFFINVSNGQLVILNNNVSRYYISGQTNEALFNFYGGDGRIEAPNLAAQVVKIYHRGSNDMIVRPIQTLEARLLSTGNVISMGYPANTPVVQQLYQGQVFFN